TIRRRRIVAVTLLVLVVAAAMTVAAVAVSRLGETDSASPPPPDTNARDTHSVSPRPPTPAAPVKLAKPFRIIFPEGFTRADMADRVTAVAQIAKQKPPAKAALKKDGYLGRDNI